MRPVGRPPQDLSDNDMAMVREYLTTDISLDAVSEKYKMPKSTVRYKVDKYRRMFAGKEHEKDKKQWIITNPKNVKIGKLPKA